MKIAFAGLGNMGLPMVNHLIQAGHSVAAYNRTPARTMQLAKGIVRVANSPVEAVRDAEVFITMLAEDAAVDAVLFGKQGAFNGLSRGAMHVSMSTLSVAFSEHLTAEHDAAGHAYVSAPVFGRPAAAEAGKLWVVAAGMQEHLQRAQAVFAAFSQGTFTVGSRPALANAVKLAGNFTLAAMLETLAETCALVRKLGIPEVEFLNILNTALYKSPVYESYGNLIAGRQFEPAGFRLRLGLKDVRLALAAAEAVEVPLPIASLVRDRMLAMVAGGAGGKDWAVLSELAARDAGMQ